jgi:NADH dehydrogenase
MDDHIRPQRVVIVGGGFGGLAAARVFRNRPVDVTIVDSAGHHVFQPLLYQCATGVLSEGQIAVPLRTVLKRRENVDCVLATVTDFDVEQKCVRALRPNGSGLQIPYDYLIMATGVGQSYAGRDEFARYAPGMKTIGDALTIRRKVLSAFEIADSATDPGQRDRWLTFVVVGGGPSGVELAGQIRELATTTLRDDFQHIAPEDAQVLLFEQTEAVLTSFGRKFSARATMSLRKLGVDLRLRAAVTDVDEHGVEVRGQDGTCSRFEAGTVLWAAGIRSSTVADALAKAAGAEQDMAGRIKVTPHCTIPGHPEIFVVGDLMALDQLPSIAEVAKQSGRYAGLCIRDRVEHRKRQRKPFEYNHLGMAAYLARGRAIVSFGPITLSGFLGWLAWLLLHITFLAGIRNRFGTILSWLVTFSRGSRRERITPVSASMAQRSGGTA